MVLVPAYILILFFLILVDYAAGIFIEAQTKPGERRLILILSIVANIGILFFFKYFNFFNANVSAFARFLGWNYPIEALSIVLPIGLSFHTFQSMSYTIEVYRGRQTAEHNLGVYALYVMFYPQLVAGPIERPQNLLHQFYEPHCFDRDRVISGLKLMVGGLFKKVVIADRLAAVVNRVFDAPAEHSGLELAIATYFFAFQIFCDFSGYSDIALGAAEVMGFRLMNNFDRPYFAGSVPEFWRRWHISLSTWFRDYLYIPLGGSRSVGGRTYLNILVVFLISGLWHGANWTFVIWGALHGLFLVFSRLLASARERVSIALGLAEAPRVKKVFSVLFTFNLVTIAWVFFRARSVEDAYLIFRKIAFVPPGSSWSTLGDGFSAAQLVISMLLIFGLCAVHLLQREKTIRQVLLERPLWQRWSAYYIFLVVFAVLVVTNDAPSQRFIYFQF
jgi:D-alanyl-lipoteichoic acid acyltransferase DltB (MBOAT superfamily)